MLIYQCSSSHLLTYFTRNLMKTPDSCKYYKAKSILISLYVLPCFQHIFVVIYNKGMNTQQGFKKRQIKIFSWRVDQMSGDSIKFKAMT